MSLPLHLLALLAALLAATLLPPAAAAQTLYKCTDATGQVAFQQTPCTGAGKAEQVQVPQPNIVEGRPAGEAGLRASIQRREAAQAALARGEVIPGLTEREVVQLLGAPMRVNSDWVNGRESRQLVYRYADGSARYVYTRDGITYASQYREGHGRPVGAAARQCYTDEQIQGADVNAGSLLHSPPERERRRAEVQRMKLNRC